MSKWQPIETAPKNDCEWVYVKGREYIPAGMEEENSCYLEIYPSMPDYEVKAFHLKDKLNEGFDWVFMGITFRPTHWKPLED